jgi:hypothetical protein
LTIVQVAVSGPSSAHSLVCSSSHFLRFSPSFLMVKSTLVSAFWQASGGSSSNVDLSEVQVCDVSPASLQTRFS